MHVNFDVFCAGKSYFIDPNGGSIADAIEVTCKSVKDTMYTCVKPSEIELVNLFT